MVKLNIDMDIEDYLVNLYDILCKNLQFDLEYYAVIDIVDKMYEVNSKKALKWSIELLNKYGIQGLKDYEASYDTKASVRYFIENLVSLLISNYSIDKVIDLIYENITLYEVRFLIWQYLFGNNNIFTDYFDTLISNRKYNEAYDLVSKVLKNQGMIDYKVFDAVNFLYELINKYTRNNGIKNQTMLDMLYSLIDLIPEEYNKAIVKCNFMEYL